MKCAFPVSLGISGRIVGCGQCMPCRITIRAAKVGRLRLEGACHEASTFATFTYADDAIPLATAKDGAPVETLRKRDWNSLRDSLRDRGVKRCCSLGEYGSRTRRPHYHAILPGVNPFHAEPLLKSVWPHGFVGVSDACLGRMQYFAGYTSKKLVYKEPCDIGQEPAFTGYPRSPAIGVRYFSLILDSLNSNGAARVIGETGDVPHCYRIANRIYPMDTYMRNWLRKGYGIPLQAADRSAPAFEHNPTDLEIELNGHRHDKLIKQDKLSGTL